MSSPHQAEGRSSPCPDVTRPADVESSAATEEVNGGVGTDEEEEQESAGISTAAGSDSKALCLETNVGCGEAEVCVAGELGSDWDTEKNAESPAASSLCCEGDQRTNSSTLTGSSEDQERLPVPDKAACMADPGRVVAP